MSDFKFDEQFRLNVLENNFKLKCRYNCLYFLLLRLVAIHRKGGGSINGCVEVVDDLTKKFKEIKLFIIIYKKINIVSLFFFFTITTIIDIKNII